MGIECLFEVYLSSFLSILLATKQPTATAENADKNQYK
jgi:hypothetical protein